MAGIKVNREGGAQTRSKAWHPTGVRLRTWLADHRRVALETSLSISRRIFGSLLVWLMIGVALAMPGLLWMLQSNLQGLSQQWQGSTGLTIYMALGASEQSLEEIATVLEREPAVIRFQLTTPQQALDELLAQSSESDLLRQAIAEIEANPGAVSVEQMLLLLSTLGAGLKLHVHAADKPVHAAGEAGAVYIPSRKQGSW